MTSRLNVAVIGDASPVAVTVTEPAGVEAGTVTNASTTPCTSAVAVPTLLDAMVKVTFSPGPNPVPATAISWPASTWPDAPATRGAFCAIVKMRARLVFGRVTETTCVPSGAVYGLVIAGMMVPMQTIIIPLSFYLGKFGMFDSYPVLILLFSAFQIPMTVFIVTGFMKSFPKEVEEAALIDGSGYFKTFFAIVLPLSAPALASASIFNFINIWNNLLFPLIFIRSAEKQLIALSLQAFFAERVSDYGGVMAAIVISILPTILAYVLLQEKVEKGLTAGAVKG